MRWEKEKVDDINACAPQIGLDAQAKPKFLEEMDTLVH